MDTNSTLGLVTSIIPLVLMVVVLYFLMIRPQNKKEKKAQEMRNSIEVGDITTIGGLVGRVASIKEDTFVLETGSDRVKIRMKRWAIQSVEKLNMDGTAPADSKKDSKK